MTQSCNPRYNIVCIHIELSRKGMNLLPPDRISSFTSPTSSVGTLSAATVSGCRSHRTSTLSPPRVQDTRTRSPVSRSAVRRAPACRAANTRLAPAALETTSSCRQAARTDSPTCSTPPATTPRMSANGISHRTKPKASTTEPSRFRPNTAAVITTGWLPMCSSSRRTATTAMYMTAICGGVNSSATAPTA